jgi:hypothetical protein
MAKISAHGAIIGTVEYATKSKRYMSDGVILVNLGWGWKLGGRVKAGITPLAAYERAKAHLEAQRIAKPAAAAYVKLLHSMSGRSHRWKLHAAVMLMPEDADGVWSEACDGYGNNIHADVDEVGELCRLYLLALREQDEQRAPETGL